jgi:geranylgeranyl diphosphate synthase, type II
MLVVNNRAFQDYAPQWQPQIEAYLRAALPMLAQNSDLQWQAGLEQAVCQGGKRLRPLLTIIAWQLPQLTAASPTLLDPAVAKVAVATEFIHASSLIFDDLPCMDNATLRRGQHALHMSFGEDKAILLALGLLLRAMELVMQTRRLLPRTVDFGQLLDQLMACVGSDGLICGQWFDLSTKQSHSELDADLLHRLRNLKTMPLIRFALLSGGILGQATASELTALQDFAQLVGESYQIIDDLLDRFAHSSYTGKDVASDHRNDRLNLAYLGSDDFGNDQLVANLQLTLEKARHIIDQAFQPSPDSPQATAKLALLAFPDYIYTYLQEAVGSAIINGQNVTNAVIE